MPLFIVIMGVSGCGKSVVGRRLAERLGWAFYEGDDYHSPENVEKMRDGTPLTDDDRQPWLQRLAGVVQRHVAAQQPAVLSCSALKPSYRALLRAGVSGGVSAHAGTTVAPGEVAFVLLDPPRPVLQARLAARHAAAAHFMPASLLDSQLAALQYEEEELLVHVTAEGWRGTAGSGGEGSAESDEFPSVQQIVDTIMQRVQEKTLRAVAKMRHASSSMAQLFWQSFAWRGRECINSTLRSSGLAATLEAVSLWMGRRDPTTRRGKIFKGSYGKSRPRKSPTNPYLQPPQPQQIPIPYPPGWQPGQGVSGGAVLA